MSQHGTLIPAEILALQYEFRPRPQLLPSSLATRRRVPLLLLLVSKSHAAGASWRTLQVLSWAVRDEARIELLSALQGDRDLPDRPIVRFDPALDRAIDLAVGLEFLDRKSTRTFRLTKMGRDIVDKLETSDALADERRRLNSLKGKVSTAEIDRFIEWRTK